MPFRTRLTVAALGVAALPAFLLSVTPAAAAPTSGSIITAAEQTAFERCTLRQPHMQTGKGLIFQPRNCRQIARAEIASLSPKSSPASREVGID